jgi:hypothetical protein
LLIHSILPENTVDQHMEELIKAPTGLAGRNARLESLFTQIAEGTAALLVAVEAPGSASARWEGIETLSSKTGRVVFEAPTIGKSGGGTCYGMRTEKLRKNWRTSRADFT